MVQGRTLIIILSLCFFMGACNSLNAADFPKVYQVEKELEQENIQVSLDEVVLHFSEGSQDDQQTIINYTINNNRDEPITWHENKLGKETLHPLVDESGTSHERVAIGGDVDISDEEPQFTLFPDQEMRGHLSYHVLDLDEFTWTIHLILEEGETVPYEFHVEIPEE